VEFTYNTENIQPLQYHSQELTHAQKYLPDSAARVLMLFHGSLKSSVLLWLFEMVSGRKKRKEDKNKKT